MQAPVARLLAPWNMQARLHRDGERYTRSACHLSPIVAPNGTIYFLEADTFSGLSLRSAFPRMLCAVGLDRVDMVRFAAARPYPHRNARSCSRTRSTLPNEK